MIAVVDYGMGNLRSVQKAFEKVGYAAEIVETRRAIEKAAAVVLPGVGAFADAMAQLRSRGMDKALLDAIDAGKPFLGVCLGLQLLFEQSFEDGRHEGLGVLSGSVRLISGDVKIPHMGWNRLEAKKSSHLLEGTPEDCYFYFVHSYVVEPAEPEIVLTTTEYAGGFVSGVEKDNVTAFQFHPEKSGDCGLNILRNFGKLVVAPRS